MLQVDGRCGCQRLQRALLRKTGNVLGNMGSRHQEVSSNSEGFASEASRLLRTLKHVRSGTAGNVDSRPLLAER